MASLSITIPDNQMNRVQAAFGALARANNPGQGQGQGGPPATQIEVRQKIAEYVRGIVRQYEMDQARNAAIGGVTDLPTEVG